MLIHKSSLGKMFVQVLKHLIIISFLFIKKLNVLLYTVL